MKRFPLAFVPALAGIAFVHWLIQRPQGQSTDPYGGPVGGVAEDHESCDGSCGHPIEARRWKTVDLAGELGCFDAEVGAWVDLGFELGSMSRGQVTMRERKPDGREVVALRLPNGDDLFLARADREWEGRVLPHSGGTGWRIQGDGNRVTVSELDFGELVCSRPGAANPEVGGLPPVDGPVVEESPGLETGEAAAIFNSLPGANGVIFLNFDGETVTGTQWNSSYNNSQPIVAGPAGFNATQVESVWKGISEDFRPFNVNITTDRALFDATPVNRRMMVIFTPDNEWYGASGGVAYIDVFGSSSFDAPCWVFTDQLANSSAYAAEAGSHETGHTLGLRHDGTSSLGYYDGHGSGATSWAPIMGVGYYCVVTQWSKGEYSGANNLEDDLGIISNSRNGLGYRVDDHSGSIGGATPMTIGGTDSISAEGIIERNTDVDVFGFQTGGGTLSLNANNGPYDPNLDIRLRVLDSSGAEVFVANPVDSLDAGLSISIPAGSYFVEISGDGVGDPSTGYSNYGSLGGYTLSGTVPLNLELAADILSPSAPEVSLPEGTGLMLDGLVTGGTGVWELVSAPAGGSVSFSTPMAASTRAAFSVTGLYTLRLRAYSGSDEEIDEVVVAVEPTGGPATFSTRAAGIDLGGDRDVYSDRLPLEPVIVDDGLPAPPVFEWTVLSGPGQLSSTSIESPQLVFSAADAPVALRLVVDDGGCRSFAEVVLTGRYRQETLVAAGAPGRVLVPVDGSLGTTWRSIGFGDGTWQSGSLGTGYDATNGPGSRRIVAPLIGTGMDIEATLYNKKAGCYLRVPFELEDPARVLSLVLRMKFDDGFVAYVNGVEIARSNVASGTPGWNSLAISDRVDDDALSAVTYPISLNPGVLVSGTNMLAIHGLNSAIAKNERRFVLAPELEATVGDAPPAVVLSPFQEAVLTIEDPNLRGAGDDADGDGRSNLYEHAAGTSLTEADAGYPMVEMTSGSALDLVLPEFPPDDVHYALEHTTAPGGAWTSFAERTGGGVWTGAAPESSSMRPDGRIGHAFVTPAGSDGFFRLRMELVAP